MCVLPLRRDWTSTKRCGWNVPKPHAWNGNWLNGSSRQSETDSMYRANFHRVLIAIRCETNEHSIGFRRATNVQCSTSSCFARSSSGFHPNGPKLNG
jgi:hypothetical protein